MIKLNILPIFYSSILLLGIILIFQIPISDLFLNFNCGTYISKSLDKGITSCVVVTFVLYLIHKESLPIYYFNFNLKDLKYYSLLLLYIVIFSGGFSDFSNFNFSEINNGFLEVYVFKIMTASFLEEFVFRGFILGIMIYNFPKTKRGFFKSVLISGVLFGCMHLINLWTVEDLTLKDVLNQVYATASFGIMYGATYLKTKSILLLGFLHFVSNFFSSLGELNTSEIIDQVITTPTDSLIISIINEILRIIIFGIPLIIGLYLISTINQSDIKAWNNK